MFVGPPVAQRPAARATRADIILACSDGEFTRGTGERLRVAPHRRRATSASDLRHTRTRDSAESAAIRGVAGRRAAQNGSVAPVNDRVVRLTSARWIPDGRPGWRLGGRRDTCHLFVGWSQCRALAGLPLDETRHRLERAARVFREELGAESALLDDPSHDRRRCRVSRVGSSSSWPITRRGTAGRAEVGVRVSQTGQLAVRAPLEPQLRSAKSRTVEATFELSFSEGLAMEGDAAGTLTDRLCRFASGAAHVSATAEAKP